MSNKKDWFDYLNVIIMLTVVFVAIYPLWYVIVISFSTEVGYYKDIYHIIPYSFTLDNYVGILKENVIFPAFWQSIKVTFIGTCLSLAITAFAGYCFSKSDLPGVKTLYKLAIVTMYVSGGLVPMYLLITNLHLKNTIWALIFPGMVSTYNVILARNYFLSLPKSLEEAALIDGANGFQIFFKIVIPLSSPILATLALFIGVTYWNAYLGAILYLSDAEKFTLPAVLRTILMNAGKAEELGAAGQDIGSLSKKFDEGMNMASIIISIIPIMIVYPFVQKYFSKGIMLGAVKG